jgi:hypothetical protein
MLQWTTTVVVSRGQKNRNAFAGENTSKRPNSYFRCCHQVHAESANALRRFHDRLFDNR